MKVVFGFRDIILVVVENDTKKPEVRISKLISRRQISCLEQSQRYFSNEYTEIFATDIGDWVMELTNTEGVTYKFRGSLCADFDYEGTDLSDLVRDTVGMDDLYVFDGNYKPDVITKITLDYHRFTKIEPRHKPEDADWKFVTWDYTEHLIIDRDTETLEHIQNIDIGCKVSASTKLKVESKVCLKILMQKSCLVTSKEIPMM